MSNKVYRIILLTYVTLKQNAETFIEWSYHNASPFRFPYQKGKTQSLHIVNHFTIRHTHCQHFCVKRSIFSLRVRIFLLNMTQHFKESFHYFASFFILVFPKIRIIHVGHRLKCIKNTPKDI